MLASDPEFVRRLQAKAIEESEAVNAMRRKPRITDKRRFRLEDKPDTIPWLGGRPDRATAISVDDIVNLRIALNSDLSLKEFIEIT